MILAAIDIGSHAARLLVAELLERPGLPPLVTRLHKARVAAELGREVSSLGIVSGGQEAFLAETLEAFSHLMRAYGAEANAACATAAFRLAANGEEVAARLRLRTGLPLEIISGTREAALVDAYHATLNPPGPGIRWYIDAGGGSTELSVYRDGMRADAASFPIGAIGLAMGTLPEERWQAMRDFVCRHAAGEAEAFATGGSIKTVFRLAGEKKKGALPYAGLRRWHDLLAACPPGLRASRYGIKPDKAPALPAGLSVYLRFMEWAGLDRIRRTGAGLAEGMLYALYLQGAVQP